MIALFNIRQSHEMLSLKYLRSDVMRGVQHRYVAARSAGRDAIALLGTYCTSRKVFSYGLHQNRPSA